MSCATRAAQLALLVIVAAAAPAVSKSHESHHRPDRFQGESSTQGGHHSAEHFLVCPSNIQDILLSTTDGSGALAEVNVSPSSLQHCPLANSPIFHNHPAGESLADRLLIYVSHKLRESPSDHSPEQSETSQWLFFLPSASITPNAPATISDLPTSITLAHLQNTHLILHTPELSDSASDTQDHQYQQPLAVPRAYGQLHGRDTDILAIRISTLSKALLERALAFQKRHDALPKLTENEALALAAREYEFADSVYVSMLTLLP